MKRLPVVLFLIAWLNGCAFTIHDSILGGSAGNGKVENGKYYVGSHGHYTEVSYSAYQFSKWHEWSAAGLIVVAMFVMADEIFSKEKRRKIPR